MVKTAGSIGPILIKEDVVETGVGPSNVRYYKSIINPPPKMHQRITVRIDQLPPQSNKVITAICPQCGKERKALYASLNIAGHSFCQPCRQRQSAYGEYLGMTIGRLTIISFSEPIPIVNSGHLTVFSARCACGKETTIYAQSVKRAIRRGAELSCGCVNVEQIRDQGKRNAGSNNGMYNPDLSQETRRNNIRRRKIQKSRNWSRDVKARDKACVICGSTERLIAHHLHDFATHTGRRYDLANGITVCEVHHHEFHYSYFGNTIEPCTASDFYRYLQEVHFWSADRVAHLKSRKQLAT